MPAGKDMGVQVFAFPAIRPKSSMRVIYFYYHVSPGGKLMYVKLIPILRVMPGVPEEEFQLPQVLRQPGHSP